MSVQTITYSNKADMQTTSVSDNNKIKASDMNSIKSVVNNNATELSTTETKLSNLNSYSTTETEIGKWVDNKPIYRKVVSGTFIVSGSRQSEQLMTGVDTLVNAYGLYSPNSNTPNLLIGAPELNTSAGIDSYTTVRTSSGNIQLMILVTQAAYVSQQGSYKVVIEYTKE